MSTSTCTSANFSHLFCTSYLSLFREAESSLTPSLRSRLKSDKNFESLTNPGNSPISLANSGGASRAERLGLACAAILAGQKEALELQISEAELLGAGGKAELGLLRFLANGEAISADLGEDISARCERLQANIERRGAVLYVEIAEFFALSASISALSGQGATAFASLAACLAPKISRSALEAAVRLAAENLRLEDHFWFAAEQALVAQTAHKPELASSSAGIYIANRFNFRAKFAAKIAEIATPTGDFAALLAAAEAGLPRNFLEPLEHSTAQLPTPDCPILAYVLLTKHRIRLENLADQPARLTSRTPTITPETPISLLYDALIAAARTDDQSAAKVLKPLCETALPVDFTSLALTVRALQRGETGGLKDWLCELLVEAAKEVRLPAQKMWLKDQLAAVSFEHAKSIPL